MESPETLVQTPPRHEGSPARLSRGRISAGRQENPGELLLARYRLLEQLGRGGFGVVWRARDELLHREVALKRVWLGSENDSERAAREALAAARLSHPAIVALHEACAHDGAFYLISELVEGSTLAQLIAEDALEDEEVLEIGIALTSALAHAHSRGVIHRDIKPQNVLVPEAPVDDTPVAPALRAAAKLTDFGGASLVGEDVLTRTGDVLGTLAYMAPEQSEGREIGAPADLYSLSLVLYEALCGVNPVRAGTPAATARRIGQRVPPLARTRRDLPPMLTAALDRGLASSPQQRGSMAELHDTLEQTLQRGLGRGRARAPSNLEPPPWPPPHAGAPAPVLPREAHAPAPSANAPQTAEQDARETHTSPAYGRRSSLARSAWLIGTLALVLWQCIAGHAGVALLAAAALVPLLALSSRRAAGESGAGWLACLLAPALGCLGLAGAFPALAGQASRWRVRAALGALGFWWLRLAEPLLARRLWLHDPVGTPARSVWESSPTLTAAHVLTPLLTLGVLLGALLWAAGALALPWLVRGRSAIRDLLAAGVWTVLLAVATPAVDAGLGAHAGQPVPRGLLAGALLAALLAVGARAARGPV